jgi:hypothetical protein
MKDVAQAWAESTRKKVKEAMKRHRPSDMKASYFNDDVIISSYSDRARKRDWTAPDPFSVIVLTEAGIGDPFMYAEIYELFEDTVDDLESQPFVEAAEWSSINPAVHVFRITPLIAN